MQWQSQKMRKNCFFPFLVKTKKNHSLSWNQTSFKTQPIGWRQKYSVPRKRSEKQKDLCKSFQNTIYNLRICQYNLAWELVFYVLLSEITFVSRTINKKLKLKFKPKLFLKFWKIYYNNVLHELKQKKIWFVMLYYI